MPHPLHTATKRGADLEAPTGGFAANVVKEWEGCGSCSGRTRLQVTDDAKNVVGYLESDYLWSLAIPEDVAEHPRAPHHIMEWFAFDADLVPVEDIDTSQSLHFAASALLRRAHDAK